MRNTYLQSIDIHNYRLFQNLHIDFDQEITVFIAPNGSGKTTVLDAICAAIRLFVNTMEGRGNPQVFLKSDIRKVLSPEQKMEYITPTSIDCTASIAGELLSWSRKREAEEDSRTNTSDSRALKEIAEKLRKANQSWAKGEDFSAPVFPLIAYYGTGRLWGGSRTTEAKKRSEEDAPNARNKGYTDSLSPSSHFGLFLDWYRDYSYEAEVNKESRHSPKQHLQALNTAVNTVLSGTGWKNIRWDFVEKKIVADHDQFGTLPIDSLSDGIRTIVGLVADIAHRAIRLNPQFVADTSLETPGIVLIDEIDMHLHPEWQQTVIDALLRTFPSMQFIVTTHSPQVLTTIPKEFIRVLSQGENGNWQSTIPAEQTKGIESSYVLASAMNTDPIPAVTEAQWLSEYKVFIANSAWESNEAILLREKIISHFGINHPATLECDRLIRFQQAKNKLADSRRKD